MIIISQNKEVLVNLDSIRHLALDEKSSITKKDVDKNIFIIYYETEQKYIYFGTYPTKEKAIKVLEMILKQHSYCELCKVSNSTLYQISDCPDMPFDTFIMPQEEDVC